jgi:hypothetical protein
MRSIFPARYVAPFPAAKYDQVVVLDWLDVEIDGRAACRMPILARLGGHRNREVYQFVTATSEEFWTRWLAST